MGKINLGVIVDLSLVSREYEGNIPQHVMQGIESDVRNRLYHKIIHPDEGSVPKGTDAVYISVVPNGRIDQFTFNYVFGRGEGAGFVVGHDKPHSCTSQSLPIAEGYFARPVSVTFNTLED